MAKKQYLDLTGLNTLVNEIKALLAGKASSSHKHAVSDVNGLQDSLNSAKTYTDQAVAQKSSVQIITWGVDD